MKKLYRVSYRQWNNSFSGMYDCEELSVGENEEEAIAKVKKEAESDARFFEAEEITNIFGYKVILNNCEQNFKSDKLNITSIANDVNRQNIFDRVIEEACRRWCYFIDEAPERKDGEGFAKFFYDIFKEKEQEYLAIYNDQQEQDCDAEVTIQHKVENMGLKEKFIDVIKEEHENFLEMIDGYDTEEIVNNSGYIAKFQAMYEYLSEYEPLTDKQMSHFLKLTNPIELMANNYNPPEEELHEEFMTVCEKIVDGRLYSINCSGNVKELLERMGDELQIDRDGENLTEDKKEVFEYMLRISSVLGQHFTNSLLQFKNPLEVIQAATKGSSSLLHVTSETEEYIDNHDIFTLPHKLDYDRLIDESKWRHDAINAITNIIPRPDFKRTMSWIDFFRTLEDIGVEFEDDPYSGFVNALKEISANQGKEILQQIYDLEKDTMIPENELIEVAKYLADGGDINEVPDLAKEDKFLKPYEELKAELEQEDEQEQGGMDLC